MPRFQIRPFDRSHAPAEIVAPHAAGVLRMIQKLECKEADVFRDDAYNFSVRLAENGMWCIFQREPVPTDRITPLAG
jgi:hypothetical protein